MKEYELPNGIRVYCYSQPNTYSVTIGLYINAGVKCETDENNGITHLLEHMHFRKLGDWEQEEIYYNMNRLGAVFNGVTYKDLLKFYMKIRPVYFFEGLEFFLRLLSTYDWNESHLESEKQVILNELQSKEPYQYITPYVDETVWKDAPYARQIIGTADSIEAITLQQILEFKRKWFCAGRIAFIITGNLSDDDLKTAMNRINEVEISQSCKTLPEIKHKSFFNRKPDMKLIDCNWDYVDINLSFDCDCANIEEKLLLNSIIGGGTGDLLSNLIREELGLTYEIYSKLDLFQEAAVLNIIFSTHKKNIYECFTQIVSVLNTVKRRITEREIAANLTYFTENLWYWLEDSEVLNDRLGLDLFKDGITAFSIERLSQTYQKISTDSLMEQAKNIFLSKNASVVIMGSTSKVTKKEIKRILLELDSGK